MEKIRWGIIGCSNIAGKSTIPTLRKNPQCSIEAVYSSRSIESARDFADSHDIPVAYDKLEAFLEREDIDAAYIGTPISRHAAECIAAANHGKHILCEKPMAGSSEECQQMLEACQKNKVFLDIAYFYPTWEKFIKIKQSITDGAIGRPVKVIIEKSGCYGISMDSHRAWKAKDGLYDVYSHTFDLIRFFLGDFKSVYALSDNFRGALPGVDTESMLITMQNGVQVNSSYSWGVNHGLTGKDLECFWIIGTEGYIDVGSLGDSTFKVITPQGTTVTECTMPEYLHENVISSFVDALINESWNYSNAIDAEKCSKLISAIHNSQKKGTVEHLS